MARNLKLEVILNAVDRATRPLRAIDRASQVASQAIRENRERLKQLQATQKDVSSFRTLSRQSTDTTSALREQQERIRRLSQQMQSNQGDTAALAVERQKAIAQARQLTQRYDEERQQLQRLRTSLKNNGVSTEHLSRDQRRLASEIQQANTAVDEQRHRLKRLAEQQRNAAQARGRYDGAMSMRSNMAGTGAGMAASGGAALYAGARLLAPGVAYGESMSRVQALTRLEADDERFQALRHQARELGATTAFSAGQSADAQGYLAMAGFDPEAIQAAMPDMLNLALANRTDLARTADISSNILSGFGLDPAEMGRVGDVLTATTTRANVDLEMLGESMKYVAPQARAMNMSLEQSAAMAGLLGNVGIQGSQAGTTLRAMVTRLAAPTGAAAGALETLGVNAKDAQGNLRDIPRILTDVARATEAMGNADRAAYLKDIFGEEPGAGMAELIAQQGSAGIEQFVEILTNAAGENARVAKTMADNIGGDLKSLSSAWDEVGISLTETNNGPLRDLIQNVTAITRSGGRWINENPRLAGTIAKVVAILAVLVTAGGALTMMLASILGPIAMVRYGMALVGPQILMAGKAFLWLGGVLRTVSMFLLANPIGIAIAAIAAAAYLIYRYWEPIKAFFQGLWQQVEDVFNNGTSGVAQLLMNLSPLGLLYQGITNALSALGVQIPEQFSSLGSAIVDGMIGGLTGKLGELRDSITGMAGSVRNWFANVLGINSPSRVFAQLGGFTVDGLISGLSSKLGELRDRVVNMAGSVRSWFANVLDINSPSRVFTQLGGDTVDGLNRGLEAQRDEPAKRIQEIARRVTRAGAGLALGAATLPVAAMPSIEQPTPIQFDTRPPLSAPNAQAGGFTMGDININVTPAPGMNEQQLAQYVAQEVQRALANAQRDALARQRSSLRDLD
ncbi:MULTISPECIES: phage tail tape measure protein [unclassified Halomonas]|uniref:phage tail tape measure protein n=1 Tax=unclassified Halomonas TaxID=2609666 RepID=UPI0004BA722F|nr:MULTISPECIES: phage tail tape measure protein [unclassified Halomonas]PKH63481.1 phage tail tape measure protein [Halomonas sp. Choline-3u-9]QGQ69817.1 phage tail tape measure protein [Halomonas sp. PA16-9]